MCAEHCISGGFRSSICDAVAPPVLHLNAALIVSWMPPTPKGGEISGDYPGIFGPLSSISVSPYLPPQWAPGPENSYLAGQDPLKWPFLATPAIQVGGEDTKEVL